MKSIAHMILIDCGKASMATRGSFNGPLSEAGGAPFNRWGN